MKTLKAGKNWEGGKQMFLLFAIIQKGISGLFRKFDKMKLQLQKLCKTTHTYTLTPRMFSKENKQTPNPTTYTLYR